MILSIDIGISHLAHCLLSNNQTLEIHEWGVVDLTGNKTQCCTMCTKKATYVHNTTSYCTIHVKKSKIPILSKSEPIVSLRARCQAFEVPWTVSETKQQLIEKLKTKCAMKMERTLASKCEMKVLGTNLVREYSIFDKYPIETVLIENQIGPIASRMKALQSMVIQYWIMKGIDAANIQCISSSNKLKLFYTEKMSYKERKQKSIEYTRACMVESCKELFENHSKKDDLADTFLQALWYLNHSNLLNADYLKLIVLSKQYVGRNN
jgi:hypothetical protein